MAARRAAAPASSALILAAAPTAPGSARSASDGMSGQHGWMMPPVIIVSGAVIWFKNWPHAVLHFFSLHAAIWSWETPRNDQSVVGAGVTGTAGTGGATCAKAPEAPERETNPAQRN